MRILKFKKFNDKRGSLFFNFYKDFDFKIRRIYFIKNFNKLSRVIMQENLKKLYVCVNGKIEISIESKKFKKINLYTGESLKVECYTWISVRGYKGSICLVLDSLDYKEEHYIRNKKEFLNIINKKNEMINLFKVFIPKNIHLKLKKLLKLDICLKVKFQNYFKKKFQNL